MKTVFVGNLNFDATDDNLAQAFSHLGSVKRANVIRNSQGGKSRGFGFVEFERAEDAQAACEQYDGASQASRRTRPQSLRRERRMKRRNSLNKRIQHTPRCFECSQNGLWLNAEPGKRCYCPRGLMLRVADSRNTAKRAREVEVGVVETPFSGGKAA